MTGCRLQVKQGQTGVALPVSRWSRAQDVLDEVKEKYDDAVL